MAQSPELLDLKPVVLANDEYDDDMTHLKEVASAEFAVNNDSSFVNRFAVTAKLISASVFATRIVQSLYFLNPKFEASRHLQLLYSLVCVGPDRKPRGPVFSQRGSNDMQNMLKCLFKEKRYEPRYEKTGFLHMKKNTQQRRRSASR